MTMRSLSTSARSRLRLAVLGVTTVVATAPVAGGSAQASTGSLRVVGLGDSVMAAGACPSCTSYLSTSAHRLAAARHRSAHVQNYARGGFRSVDVLRQLRTSAVRDAVRRSDVTVIEIGANDFRESSARNPNCDPAKASGCFTGQAATMRANLSLIVSRVKALQQRPGAQVVLMGYWNVFRDGQVGRAQGGTYVKVSNELTGWVNSMTWDVARRQGARYADAYKPLRGSGDATRYLAPDGDHPNAAGHARLAASVANVLGA